MSAEPPKPQELSEEEIAERIKRTEESEDAQLLLKLNGKPEIWNALVCRQMGEEKWQEFVERLPSEEEEKLKAEKILPYMEEKKNEYLKRREELKKTQPISDEVLKEYDLKVDQNLKLNCKQLYFKNDVNLSHFVFPQIIQMYKSYFQESASFTDAQFQESASFTDAQFQGGVDFTDAQFQDSVGFTDAQFQEWADFRGAEFQGLAYFKGAEFQGWADFEGAHFQDWANFEGVKFQNRADFTGAQFEDTADFQNGQFATPPMFSKAKIDTVFFSENRKYFQNDSPKLDAAQSKHAWQVLIKLMDDMHNLPQRQIFHEKLLQIEELEEKNKAVKCLYKTYRNIGSGYSILWPFVYLKLCIFTFAHYYYLISNNVALSISYAFANSLPFLSSSRKGATNFLDSIAVDEQCEIASLFSDEACQQIIAMFLAGFQNFLSLIFLFLIGLALRNRFRIK